MQSPPDCIRKGNCTCDASHRAPWPRWSIDGVSHQTCPRYLVTEHSWSLLRLYGHYRRGILPFQGALFDQPHRFVEAMEIIGNHINDYDG